MKKQEEENQEALLDEMINNVKQVKKGNKDISRELDEQDVIIDVSISSLSFLTVKWIIILRKWGQLGETWTSFCKKAAIVV